MHYRIAELLFAAAKSPPTYSELFAIVQQFNKAGPAVPRERRQLVIALNLDAWERAKVTAAHDAAYVRIHSDGW